MNLLLKFRWHQWALLLDRDVCTIMSLTLRESHWSGVDKVLLVDDGLLTRVLAEGMRVVLLPHNINRYL